MDKNPVSELQKVSNRLRVNFLYSLNASVDEFSLSVCLYIMHMWKRKQSSRSAFMFILSDVL